MKNKWILNWRDSLMASIVVISFVCLFFLKPIPQDLAYHLFADNRTILGISNFFDVVSNLPFFFIGFLGSLTIIKHWGISQSWSWLILFLAVLLVSLGSAYYHLSPENKTLTWDRLPMAIAFMALFVIVLTDYVNISLEKWLLLPMCLLGVFSVIYWHMTDDLRIYAWVQFVSMALLLIIMFVYKPTYLRTSYLVFAFFFYMLSKIAEYFDQQFFEFFAQLISGHTIKHLLASIATLYFYFLLRHRLNQYID
ncbi:MAG: hypothetical protein AAF304_01740 [Pseudomonadota bacterium]